MNRTCLTSKYPCKIRVECDHYALKICTQASSCMEYRGYLDIALIGIGKNSASRLPQCMGFTISNTALSCHSKCSKAHTHVESCLTKLYRNRARANFALVEERCSNNPEMRAALLASLKSLSPASFKVSRFGKLSLSILHQSAFHVSPISLEYSLQMTTAKHSERKCVPNYPALPYRGLFQLPILLITGDCP